MPGPKRVLLAAPRGYCAGVDRAVVAVEKALERNASCPTRCCAPEPGSCPSPNPTATPPADRVPIDVSVRFDRFPVIRTETPRTPLRVDVRGLGERTAPAITFPSTLVLKTEPSPPAKLENGLWSCDWQPKGKTSTCTYKPKTDAGAAAPPNP